MDDALQPLQGVAEERLHVGPAKCGVGHVGEAHAARVLHEHACRIDRLLVRAVGRHGTLQLPAREQLGL
eukprot:CAMPEP_0174731826 /NCGR_PEP_ID=MMETSP1094-20130205/58252_1 /TAXON_ID=156173 /ORGANISM="Chrysochromulina brevifilum, Strain UTEX LB 985" /LENGTH=68 /DNA_ID=CAMNT_0015934251 /DNA_START=172 /DNA_END=378 /DNA_ORIENTATION=+